MPNIREFNTPALGLTPSSVGTEATAGAARRIGQFYNQAGEALQTTGQRIGGAVRDAGDVAVKYAEHREISLGSKNLAELQANQVSAWNAAAKNADPNDPTVAAKFNEETLEPALKQFSGSFMTEGGQRFAQESANRFRQHMFEKTAADMSSMAADAVHMNVVKTMNAAGNMVYNDPSSLEFARGNLQASVASMADSSPNITPAQAAKVKNDLMMEGETHLVRASIMGAIAKGGDWKHIADDPKNAPYVNQAEIETFARAAKAQARNDENIRKQGILLQKQMDDQAVHVQANKTFADNVKIDPVSGHPTINPNYFQESIDLARKFPNAPNAAQTAKTAIDWGEHQQAAKREPVISDPEMKRDLLTRLDDPDKPTSRNEILRAEIGGKLSPADRSDLLNLQKDTAQSRELQSERKDFIGKFARTIDPSMVEDKASALGQEKLYAFEMGARQQEDALRKKGLDPHLVYDPRSEYFFGKRENLEKYRATLADSAKYMSDLKKRDAAVPSPKITSKADYDALKPGTSFLGEDGKTYRKP